MAYGKDFLAADGQPINRRSRLITYGFEHPAARAQLAGAGLTHSDIHKAQVAVVHNGFDQNTCNMHLAEYAGIVKESVDRSDRLMGWIFPVGGVSDGITMGTPGMHYSLASREWIADAFEGHVNAHHYDGAISMPGCDKNMPGDLIGMARLNIPSFMLYGGTIEGGCYKGKKTVIVTPFEYKMKFFRGEITEREMLELIEGSGMPGDRGACPGKGACGGMYTANTMSSAIEALGMTLPNSSSAPATSADKMREMQYAGKAMETLLDRQILPKDIMTRKAFDNAMTVVMALGGSTNAVLHLLAIARAADIDLKIDDFQTISDRTPYLADMAPSGRYLMEDLHSVGGTQGVLKLLHHHGLIYGDCMTVTGLSMEENLVRSRWLADGQDVIRPYNNPISKKGHIKILYGNVAPTSAVAKITGKEGRRFSGPANIFNSEEEAIYALKEKKIRKGDVVVIRNEGPKGGPGMREMLDFTSAVVGDQLGKEIATVTDGRFSGGTHGFSIAHVTPEAYVGGPIALLRNGDRITIDADELSINADVSAAEFGARRREWKDPEPRHKKGLLYKTIRDMSQANFGAVTDM